MNARLQQPDDHHDHGLSAPEPRHLRRCGAAAASLQPLRALRGAGAVPGQRRGVLLLDWIFWILGIWKTWVRVRVSRLSKK